MYKEHGWESSLVTHKNDEYTYIHNEVKGLNLYFLSRKKGLFFLDKSVVSYLFSKAKSIDVLNLYHLNKQTLLYGLIYMALNKKGAVYLKMDVYNEHLANGIIYSKKKWKNNWFKKIEKKFILNTKLISIENPIGLKLFEEKYTYAKHKIVLMPNGIDINFAKKIPLKRLEDKENIILSVGRIGHPEKNHEILLNALEKIDLKDWKVFFVGPVEDNFKATIDGFYERNPNLKEKIIFKGACFNRVTLYEYYNSSKVFCLTSKAESFGISFVEALFFGNFLIGNEKMFAFDLITDNGNFGHKFKEGSINDLVRIIKNIISEQHLIGEKYESSINYARTNFCWGKLTKLLDLRLSNNKSSQ